LDHFILRKFLFFSLVISLSVAFLELPALANHKMILRCADVQAPGYPTVEGLLFMSRLIRKETNGRIEITVYPNGALGPESSVVDMVRLGALDMGRVSLSQMVNIDPNLEVLLLPYIFRADNQKWNVLEGPIGNRLLEGLTKSDLIGLCFFEAGYRSFYNSKRPVFSPSDLAGLKIRVQPSPIMIKMIDFLGAAAVPIDYNEVYSALAAKAVDGAENNLPSYLSTGHYKVARYFSFDRHSSIPEVVFISKKTFNKLTPSDQEIIRGAAKEAVLYQRKLWAQYENESYLKLLHEGCKFNEVNVEAFKERFKPFYQRFAYRHMHIIEQINQVN
jgi:tripartite ATP-independent transporter DctP family solute receptor